MPADLTKILLFEAVDNQISLAFQSLTTVALVSYIKSKIKVLEIQTWQVEDALPQIPGLRIVLHSFYSYWSQQIYNKPKEGREAESLRRNRTLKKGLNASIEYIFS